MCLFIKKKLPLSKTYKCYATFQSFQCLMSDWYSHFIKGIWLTIKINKKHRLNDIFTDIYKLFILMSHIYNTRGRWRLQINFNFRKLQKNFKIVINRMFIVLFGSDFVKQWRLFNWIVCGVHSIWCLVRCMCCVCAYVYFIVNAMITLQYLSVINEICSICSGT